VVSVSATESVAIIAKFLFFLGKFQLNVNFALFHRRGDYKQAAKEEQCISIPYVNLGKHTVVIKQQTTFLK